MRTLEPSHGLNLGERDPNRVGGFAPDLLDGELATGRQVPDEVDEREAAFAEQSDERVRAAVDLGEGATGGGGLKVSISPRISPQLDLKGRTLSSDEGLQRVVIKLFAKSVA